KSAAVPAAVGGERTPPTSLDFGLGRQALAETREPEDLPAIASLFRWTGRSIGTVNRAGTRLVRDCCGGPSMRPCSRFSYSTLSLSALLPLCAAAQSETAPT